MVDRSDASGSRGDKDKDKDKDPADGVAPEARLVSNSSNNIERL